MTYVPPPSEVERLEREAERLRAEDRRRSKAREAEAEAKAKARYRYIEEHRSSADPSPVMIGGIPWSRFRP
jgi:hypothetical protein